MLYSIMRIGFFLDFMHKQNNEVQHFTPKKIDPYVTVKVHHELSMIMI